MQLLLIRHAQSSNNKVYAETGGTLGRVPDPDITEAGQRQAQCLADFVAAGHGYPRITHLYSSLMRRTIQTAAPLADALDLPIDARMDSHEHPGPFDGSHDDRVPHRGSGRSVLAGFSSRARLPEGVTDDGWYTGELETEELLAARARAVIADLRANHGEDDVVALVSHGWFGSVLVQEATGASPECWFMHHNTATTLLSWEMWAGDSEVAARPQTAILWTNRTDHLTRDLLTE